MPTLRGAGCTRTMPQNRSAAQRRALHLQGEVLVARQKQVRVARRGQQRDVLAGQHLRVQRLRSLVRDLLLLDARHACRQWLRRPRVAVRWARRMGACLAAGAAHAERPEWWPGRAERVAWCGLGTRLAPPPRMQQREAKAAGWRRRLRARSGFHCANVRGCVCDGSPEAGASATGLGAASRAVSDSISSAVMEPRRSRRRVCAYALAVGMRAGGPHLIDVLDLVGGQAHVGHLRPRLRTSEAGRGAVGGTLGCERRRVSC